MLNIYKTVHNRISIFNLVGIFLFLLISEPNINAQAKVIKTLEPVDSINTQPVNSSLSIVGNTSICLGTKTNLTLRGSCSGTIIWKTTKNNIIGNGRIINISPKITTSYFATCKVGDTESKPSNTITLNVNVAKFSGLPNTPANYEITTKDPFYLGVKSANTTPLRWKHESNIGNETLIKPTADSQTYYVRYEEPESGCVSAWKPVTVRLVAENKNNNIQEVKKGAKIAANTPASSCASMASSSDAQLCSNTTFPALVNNTTNGGTASTSWGCLRTRPNQSWFYFIPLTSGSVSFAIGNTAGVDIDGAVWGPVNSVADACVATQSTPLSCDYTTSANVPLSIASVTAGKVYVIVITNYSNRATTVNFPANSGTASIGCCTLTGLTASATAITCNGGTSTTTVNYTGTPTGTATYSKDGVNYQASNVFSGLNAGTYTFYVKDNFCTKFNSITINQPTSISFGSPTITNVTCTGNSNGKIVVSASGGTGSIGYSISPSVGSQSPSGTFNNLTAGSYTITATDANGCTATTTANVSTTNITPSAPTAISASPATICSGQSSTLSANCTTGTLTWYSDVNLTAIITNTVSPSTSTTYYVACVTGSVCKSTSGNVTVTVNQTPTAPTSISASPSTICSGQSSTLSATCATGTTTWYSNAALTSVIASPSPATPSNTTTYYVACVSSAGCKSSSGSATVTVNPTPTAPTSVSASPMTICSGQSSTLSANCATGTVTWYSNAGLTTIITSPSPATPAITTTYYVACVSSAGCKSTGGSVTVTVNPTPTTPTSVSASPTTICSGQSSTLGATCATGTTTWYSDAALTSVIASPSPATPSSTTTYYVACVSSAGCKSTAGNVTVTVNPTPTTPTAISASPSTICSGQSSTLSATCATGTVTWYSNAGLTSIIASPSPATPSTTTTYYVACVSSAGCKSSGGNVTITVNQTPTAPTAISASPATICSGQSSTLSATCATGTTTWYSDAALTNVVSSPVSPTSTTTYYVSCVSGAGCKSTSGSITVTVNPTPSAPTSISASPSTICSGQSSTLGATCATGAVTWYTNSGLTNVISSPVSPTSTTTYYVSCVSNAGCKSTSGNTTVTVNPTPSAPTNAMASPATICSGQNSTLSATCTTGTETWYSDAALTNVLSSTTVSPTSNTSYYVSCVSVAGCKSSSVNVGLAVNQTPSAPTAVSASPTTICSGQISTLSATCVTGIATWYTTAALTTIVSNTVSPSSSTSYYVACVSSTGCKSSAMNVGITVNPTPPLPTVSSVQYCQGATPSQLVATGSSGATLLWYSVPTGGTGSTTAPTPSTAITGTTNYYVSQMLNTCETERVTLAVVVNQNPSLSLTAGNITCAGAGKGTIIANTTDGTPAYTYSKDNGLTFQSGNIFSGINAGTYNIIAKDSKGCSNTQSITVTQSDPIVLLSETTNDCTLGNNGIIKVSGSGGTAPLTYNLNGGTYGASTVFSNLSSGVYTIGVQDANGCTLTSSVSVNSVSDLTIALDSQNDCIVGNTGSITVEGNGGTSPYNFRINGGTWGGNTFNSLSAGTYTIDVLDARSCMKSLTVTITENPSAPTTTSPTLCLGESTTLSGTCLSGIINWYSDASLTTPLTTTTVTPSVTTTYYATCEIASIECISSSSTSIVTVNPIPTVNVVANQVLCKGALSTAVAFSGTDTGTIFSWTNTNANIGLGASGIGDILAFTSTNSGVVPINGTITVTPTFTNNEVTCTGLPTNFTITVNPVPTVNDLTNISVCNASTIPAVSFSGTVANTVYSWTNSNTNIGLGASGTGDIATFSATNSTASPITGNITVTPSFTSSSVTCTGSAKTFAIAVNPTPTVNAVANQTLCNGSSTTAISFTGAVSGTVYSWTNTNANIGLVASGIGNIATFNATNSGVLPISGTITITPSYTNNGITCTGTPQNFTITVNPTPTVNPISNQTLCNGSPTTAIGFTGAVSGATYSWTNTNSNIGLAVSGAGDIPIFNVTNSSNLPISGTISVIPSFTNNGVACTGTSQNFTITVNPIPTVNSVSEQTLCNGSATTTVNFTGAVTGTNYSWTNTNSSIGLATSGSGDIATFTATNATNAPISGTITVTPTFTNNGVICTGTAKNVAITVNPTPSVNSISNQTLCNGAATTAVNFTGAVTGTTYAWTNTNASIGLVTSGSGDISTFTATNATNAPISGTITVTPSFTNNGVTCTGASQNFTITVNPIPTVNTITNNTLCHGTSTTAINFTGNVSNTVYSWANTNSSIGLDANGTGNILPFTAINSGTTVSTGTITVTPSFTNNGVSCVGTPKNFTISVNPIPSVNAISDQLICNNSATTAVNFSGTVAGTSYDWTNTNTNIGLAASGSGNIASFTAQNSTNSPISGTITVVPNFTNNGVTCTNTSQSFNIAVNPTPTVNSIANQSLCNGVSTSAVSFTGSVAGTVYSWTNSDAGIGLSTSGTGDIPAFTITNTGSSSILGTITVTPSYSNNGLTCVGVAKAFTISANPIPKATITPDVINICSGDNVSLSITDEKAVSGSTSYTWSRDNTSNLTGLPGVGSVTAISGIVTNVTSSTQISVIIANVTSQFGCSSMGIAKIAVTPPLLITISGNTFFCGTGQINKFTTLTASPVGGTGSYSYQWKLNGTAISGATNSTYDASSAGNYTVTVVSEFCTKTSNTITVNDPYNLSAQPTVSPSSSAICGSGTVSLTASSTSTLGTFNWYNTPTSLSSLSPTSGIRNEVYNTPTLSSSQTYYVARIYSVVGSVPLISCETDRTSVSITVNSTPTTPVVSGSVIICKGGNTDLILTSGCTGTITWKNATTNAVVGTGSPLNVSPTVTTGYNATCSENGCISNNSNTVTVTVSNITLTATPTNLTCKSNTSGQITLTATGGTSAYTYSKDGTNFQNGNTFTGLSAGNYTLTVKDANACSAMTTVTLTEPAVLALSATPTNLTCKSNATGQITLTASGGTSAYTYSKDGTNFQNSNTFTGLSAGNYTLTVKDANVCSLTTTVTLTEPNTLTLSAGQVNLICKSNASGQITLTATGGTSAYTYSKDGTNFQNGNVFTGFSAGNYTLTVKDANACSATTTVTLTEPAVLSLSASQVNLTCKSNASGQITLTATGGTSAYTYSIDGTTFQNSNVFTGLSAGNYTLTVKDANVCSATTTVTLTEPAVLSLSASQVNLTCKSNASGQITLTATGGTSAYTYSIDGTTFQNSNVFTGLSAGNYTLTVKDANACSATTTVTLTEPMVLSLSANQVNLTCKSNASGQIALTATGGTSAFTYSIDGTNFQNSNTFTGLSVGNYTLTVKDANACSATTSVILTEPAVLSLSASQVNLTCKSNASGQITLTATGGTSAYTYSIDGTNFQSGNTFTGLSAGNYTLTVKDANACSATTMVTLTEPAVLSLSANQVNLTCKSNASGQITLTATGGTSAYTYSIDGTNFQNGNTFTGLSAGNYTLTVKDANTCSATTSVTLTEPNTLTLSASQVNLTCKSNASGQITLTASGGTSAYSYSIDGTNFQNSNTFTGLSAGNYTLTVKDANTCSATTSVTLTEPNTLTLSASQVNLTCKSNASGQITLTASGGTSAYSYSIDGTNFQNSNTFTGLSAGNYTLTVKDANTCSATTSVTLTEPAVLSLSANQVNLTCKSNASGQITLTATGGTSAYTYSIDGTNFQSGNTFTSLSSGNYTLTVKDANACSATTTVTLTEPNTLTLSAGRVNLTCKANASGQITLTASGGTSAYTYSIDGTNFQSGNVFTGLSAGNYTLTVKDANACSATTTVTLTEPAVLSLSASQVNLTCKSNASGQITLTASGGTSAYSYSIDGTNFQSGNTFTGLSAGNYTLTVKDANACSATTTVTLTEPAVLSLSASQVNLTCKSNASGQIALTATGGTSTYTYSIDGTTFQSSNTFTGLSAGNYTLTVKDANACSATTMVTLAEPAVLSLSANQVNLTCKANASGQITLTASGGTSAYSYSIDGTNFQSGNTFTGLSAGNYTLTVKDANACSATTTVTLTEPNTLTLSASQVNLTCKSNASGQITLTPTGGTSAFTYSIDGTTFQSGNTFTGLSAGNYTLTVKDANACSVTTMVTLTEPAVLALSAIPTNLTCKSNASGQITLTATGGTTAYSYSIDGTTFQNSNVFTGLSAGNYTLTVKDANACSATITVTLTEPAVLSLSANQVNLTCKSNASGQITLTATGGTSAYTYSKDGTNFQSGNTFTGLSAGNYTLTVKDANACSATTTVTLTEPAVLALSATPTNLTCKSNTSGQITLTPTGGTSAYTYSIDGTNFQNSNTFTGLSAGNYTLTVKDANACSATTATVIADGKAILPPSVSGDISVCLGSPLSLSNISSDNANKLLWYDNNVLVSAPLANTIGKKTYFVSQLSPEGCESAKASVNIIVRDCTPAVFDLALRKTIADTNKTYKPNDIITFNVIIVNQGDVKAYNIDVIDYIPQGMSFIGNNSKWTQSDVNAISRIDSLSAKDSLTLKISMRVNLDAQNGNLLNKAEIFGADLDKSGKIHVTSDIDSRFDKNPNNDIGGKENSPTDNVIWGDGDGRFDIVGGIDPKHDEDDEDPALITIFDSGCFDLALRKQLISSPVTAMYLPNDSLRFEITVFNQCKTQKAYHIDVVDYLPKETSFIKTTTINQQWISSIDTLFSINKTIISIDTNAVTRIDSLAGGDSTKFEITLKIKPNALQGAYINKAEIFKTTLDKAGKYILTSDYDSRYDKNPNNDIGGKENSPTDNVILGDGDGRYDVVSGVDPKHDEDDEDPAMFVIGSIDCLVASVDSVQGNKWFNLYDKYGRLYASVNPNGQNLGQVTLQIRHYGNGAPKIPITLFGTQLMSRYYNIKSSLKDSFDVAVSVRTYYLNTEFNDYKKATNLPLLTINDFNIVHYEGVRENCGFEDNDNFTNGISEVLYKNIIGKTFTPESFYLEFNLTHFSELGATANKYATAIVYDVNKRDEKSAIVTWETDIEIRSNYFIIERSKDCVHFEEIGRVTAVGTGNKYEFIDNFPMGGINCYRIIYIDKDGTRKVFDPKQVEFDNLIQCSVFPNPLLSFPDFNLYFKNIEVKEIKIYNVLGQNISFDYSIKETGLYKISTMTPLHHTGFVVIYDDKGNRCVVKVQSKY
ncbi:hypothetical protein VB796_22755 [Arcicella sp. LKC2W]|uniref:Ig-like domain-containing protein n=1 Tax=Arcicella sp. LKC2W TaxID=2984198 RepID=UPI002B1ED412|nr:hypothetical protein [Arcicella sp. LKC2W]MEA5461908.1 hypothetical protein [Arcicella sp. LKC2W]